jgi:hypothetical protein
LTHTTEAGMTKLGGKQNVRLPDNSVEPRT